MPVRLNWVHVEHFMRLRGIEDANELAVFAETHRSNMFRIAQGKSLPNMVTLARMCFYLGCQPGDLLNYEHSEDDLSKPHLLFGLFPINQKVWTKFRKLDKSWRKDVGRWELKSGGVDLVDFDPSIHWEWREGLTYRYIETVISPDGEPGEVEMEEVGWITTLRDKLLADDTDSYGVWGRAVMDRYNAADNFAKGEIVEAIEPSYFKYVTTVKSLVESKNFEGMNFEDFHQLEFVYKNDHTVTKAREAYQVYKKRPDLEWGVSSLPEVKAVLLGLEIERDWHVLSKYQYANTPEVLIDYVEHYAIPIKDMDESIAKVQRLVANLSRRAKRYDEALAQDIAQGMDDKED
jgi:DNA-binding Xre family transcriptional regulator